MTVDDIKVWVIDRGIGHVVMSRNDSSPLGTRTACDIMGNMYKFTYCMPKRICKKCRQEIPNLVRSPEAHL